MTPTAALQAALTDLTGPTFTPADPDYDAARRVYNAMIDKSPALIVQAHTVADVVAGVNAARDHGVLLAVRGGGHNGGGLGTCDDGLVIDLAALDSVEVDAEGKTVRVGGGATWGQVDAATGAHGLAVPSGIISTTGVGGLTLGGGLGHLTRTYGLAIDNLLAAEVVLADGRQVRASATEEPDLFWALRGGGGNFGVVTSFTFRLNDVSAFVGGPTFWDVGQGDAVLEAYRDFIPNAPRELNGFFAYTQVPPAPPFPEELHLRPVCAVVWAYVGDEDGARTAMAPLLDALPAPLLHGVAPMPHAALQTAFDGLYPKGQQWYWRADFVNTIPDEAVTIHQRFGSRLPTFQSTMHLYPINGAAHDVEAGDTAWAYRDATWGSVFAGVSADPADAAELKRWCVDYFEALHPHSAGGAYVNMMMDEGEERIRASYRGNYARLAQIKAAYDPDNLFRVNQNIKPAAAAAVGG
ncbi:FAD-binding oxidoreductase [Microlunatus aurantiacus]|uniref:FAD-binding oxidoreductase n=1 Tax=Microlunatus aurantiacus TaxID=446786 RepID=A0ABP7DJG2_9ACTN